MRSVRAERPHWGAATGPRFARLNLAELEAAMSLDSLNKKSRRLFTPYLSLALAGKSCRSWLPQVYGWTASSGADLAVLQRARALHEAARSERQNKFFLTPDPPF